MHNNNTHLHFYMWTEYIQPLLNAETMKEVHYMNGS
jgi:hypothetical protein